MKIRWRLAGIMTAAAITMVSCDRTVEPDKYEFGEPGPMIELMKKDGEYVPKTPPVAEHMVREYFQGTWKLKSIKNISYTGSLDDVVFSYADGKGYPFFAVKEEGRIRQYIDTPDGSKTFKDGTYSYEPASGIIYFKDVADRHPEFRILDIDEYEMSGTFKGEYDSTSDHVLTLYLYTRLSYLDEYGLDTLYGAE